MIGVAHFNIRNSFFLVRYLKPLFDITTRYFKKNPDTIASGSNILIYTLHSRQLYLLLQFQYTFFKKVIGIHQILHGLATMNNSSMIPSAKMLANRF